jgi:hypothetical protein
MTVRVKTACAQRVLEPIQHNLVDNKRFCAWLDRTDMHTTSKAATKTRPEMERHGHRKKRPTPQPFNAPRNGATRATALAPTAYTQHETQL